VVSQCSLVDLFSLGTILAVAGVERSGQCVIFKQALRISVLEIMKELTEKEGLK
jgi:hypothetical protein